MDLNYVFMDFNYFSMDFDGFGISGIPSENNLQDLEPMVFRTHDAYMEQCRYKDISWALSSQQDLDMNISNLGYHQISKHDPSTRPQTEYRNIYIYIYIRTNIGIYKNIVYFLIYFELGGSY